MEISTYSEYIFEWNKYWRLPRHLFRKIQISQKTQEKTSLDSTQWLTKYFKPTPYWLHTSPKSKKAESGSQYPLGSRWNFQFLNICVVLVLQQYNAWLWKYWVRSELRGKAYWKSRFGLTGRWHPLWEKFMAIFEKQRVYFRGETVNDGLIARSDTVLQWNTSIRAAREVLELSEESIYGIDCRQVSMFSILKCVVRISTGK